LLARLDLPRERDRILTEPDMRVSGRENVWALGDCAHIINDYDGSTSPPTGQFAERQGKQAADNIIRILDGKGTKPFRFKPIGELCAIGGGTKPSQSCWDYTSQVLLHGLFGVLYICSNSLHGLIV
ncbi:hypothetical protein MYX76_17625, partial [Desulfobacterota bacterium AH_259_B03_O07]|nr:hypothetical protein [Desulfobacterota bacterium AH_259_B03_O07]